jgi:hypothetical protein
MTCLYCGKKLGFFSRYKDTPFCSEEHLRIHQDELERALMERLGTKTASPAKSLGELGANQATPLQSMMGLESATRQDLPVAPPPPVQETRPLREVPSLIEPPLTLELSTIDKMPKPVEKPVESPVEKPVEKPAPAPLQEDFFFEMPQAAQWLDTTKPLIPPSSFAIIVQTDCCTPNLSELVGEAALPFENAEFTFDPTGVAVPPAELELKVIEAFDTESFGAPWVQLPTKTELVVEADDIVPTADFIELEFTGGLSPMAHTPLGNREEIDPRIRLRYPYAASQVTSTFNSLPISEETFTFTDSTEWAPVEPPAAVALAPVAAVEDPARIEPFTAAPLSVSGRLNFNLLAADTEEFGDTLNVLARKLDVTQGLATAYDAGEWKSSVIKPVNANQVEHKAVSFKPRRSHRVPPVPFPSLFQLGPVLPPRPESGVN